MLAKDLDLKSEFNSVDLTKKYKNSIKKDDEE